MKNNSEKIEIPHTVGEMVPSYSFDYILFLIII